MEIHRFVGSGFTGNVFRPKCGFDHWNVTSAETAMSESSDTNSTPRSGDVVVDTSPGGNSSPQGGVDTTSERPGLDADEMRRRRLAKINSSNANVRTSSRKNCASDFVIGGVRIAKVLIRQH